MRVPRVQFTVRRLIGAITIVALILALVIQSVRVARLERELAACQEVSQMLLGEVKGSREILREWWALFKGSSPELKARAEESLDGRTRDRRPPKGRSPGAERVPVGRGRARPEPPSPGPVEEGRDLRPSPPLTNRVDRS